MFVTVVHFLNVSQQENTKYNFKTISLDKAVVFFEMIFTDRSGNAVVQRLSAESQEVKSLVG